MTIWDRIKDMMRANVNFQVFSTGISVTHGPIRNGTPDPSAYFAIPKSLGENQQKLLGIHRKVMRLNKAAKMKRYLGDLFTEDWIYDKSTCLSFLALLYVRKQLGLPIQRNAASNEPGMEKNLGDGQKQAVSDTIQENVKNRRKKKGIAEKQGISVWINTEVEMDLKRVLGKTVVNSHVVAHTLNGVWLEAGGKGGQNVSALSLKQKWKNMKHRKNECENPMRRMQYTAYFVIKRKTLQRKTVKCDIKLDGRSVKVVPSRPIISREPFLFMRDGKIFGCSFPLPGLRRINHGAPDTWEWGEFVDAKSFLETQMTDKYLAKADKILLAPTFLDKLHFLRDHTPKGQRNSCVLDLVEDNSDEDSFRAIHTVKWESGIDGGPKLLTKVARDPNPKCCREYKSKKEAMEEILKKDGVRFESNRVILDLEYLNLHDSKNEIIDALEFSIEKSAYQADSNETKKKRSSHLDLEDKIAKSENPPVEKSRIYCILGYRDKETGGQELLKHKIVDEEIISLIPRL